MRIYAERRDDSTEGGRLNDRSHVLSLQTLVTSQTDSIGIQACRYAVSGAIATFADAGVLYLLTSIVGLPYLLSAAFGFTVGLILNYMITIRWVFGSRTVGNRAGEFTVFAVIGMIGLGLTEIILYGGVRILAVHYMTAKMAAVAVVFLWNFTARRALLFKRGRSYAA